MKRYDDDIEKQLAESVRKGHMKKVGGKYRITEKGTEDVAEQLKTDREARAIFRAMNVSHGLDVEQGLPKWQGEKDEFPAGGVRLLPTGNCPKCEAPAFHVLIMDDKGQQHFCTSCDYYDVMKPCAQCGAVLFAKLVYRNWSEPVLVCDKCGSLMGDCLVKG